MDEPKSPNESCLGYEMRTLPVNLFIGILVILLVILVGKEILGMENRVINETLAYCEENLDIEMWDSPHGMTNCTAWREGKVMAI